jgi:hypothetical protein
MAAPAKSKKALEGALMLKGSGATRDEVRLARDVLALVSTDGEASLDLRAEAATRQTQLNLALGADAPEAASRREMVMVPLLQWMGKQV